MLVCLLVAVLVWWWALAGMFACRRAGGVGASENSLCDVGYSGAMLGVLVGDA